MNTKHSEYEGWAMTLARTTLLLAAITALAWACTPASIREAVAAQHSGHEQAQHATGRQAGVSDLWALCAATFLIGVMLAVVGMAAPAHAAPYGGCEEAWQAPQSKGAQACRASGWTVRARISVNKHGVVRAHRLPSCEHEDGSGSKAACSWNIRSRDGNGSGLALWYDPANRAHFVWRSNPTYNRDGWQWTDRRLARALASTEGHSVRFWRRCVVKYGDTTRVRCADGTRVTS